MIALSKDSDWQLGNLDIMFTNSNGMIRSSNNRGWGVVLSAQKENRWNCGNEVRSEWRMITVSPTGRIVGLRTKRVREELAHLTIRLRKPFERIRVSCFHDFGHCRFWVPDSQRKQANTGNLTGVPLNIDLHLLSVYFVLLVTGDQETRRGVTIMSGAFELDESGRDRAPAA